jgi:outer membrane protein assembly factor BamB
MMRYLRHAALLLAAMVLSACGGKEAASPPRSPEKALETARNTPPAPPSWPTFHGAPTLDGVADVSLPDALAQVWKFDAGGPVLNTPVVGDGHIFFTDTKGTIFALDLAGRSVWTKNFNVDGAEGKPPKRVFFDAPLAIFEGVVIAGNSDGVVYALNAADGSLRWQCDTELPILGTPNLAEVTVDGKTEKRLYIIDQSAGGLQCIDFTGGKLLWKSAGKDRCDGSPAVNGSVAVYGSCASAVHIFSSIDGKILREIPLDQDSQIAGGVVLLGDSIYSGSRSGKFIHANAQTGKIIWENTDCDGECFSTPAVGKDQILFGANNSMLYSLDRKTGALQWKVKLGDTPTSPVIARDKAIVAANGALVLLRLSDGKKLWSLPVSDEITSPAMAGALVVVGADDGTVTAFGEKTGE